MHRDKAPCRLSFETAASASSLVIEVLPLERKHRADPGKLKSIRSTASPKRSQ